MRSWLGGAAGVRAEAAVGVLGLGEVRDRACRVAIGGVRGRRGGQRTECDEQRRERDGGTGGAGSGCGSGQRFPGHVEPVTVALQRAREKRAEGETEDDVARGVAQIERQPAAGDDEVPAERVLAGVHDPEVQVHEGAVGEAGQRAGRRQRPAPQVAAEHPRQQGAEDPTPPHAAICHGVNGPWPKKTLDASAATEPTAKPGAPPST